MTFVEAAVTSVITEYARRIDDVTATAGFASRYESFRRANVDLAHLLALSSVAKAGMDDRVTTCGRLDKGCWASKIASHRNSAELGDKVGRLIRTD